jgi:hypothetical protein
MTSTASTSEVSHLRFAITDPNTLLKEKHAKSTVNSTNYAKRLFTDFIKTFNEDILCLPEKVIDNHLQNFYSSVRQSDGSEFSSTSLTNLRYGISRWLLEIRHIDIIKDPQFAASTEIYKCKLCDLKRKGKGTVDHIPFISDEDLAKISSMAFDTPVRLQWKTWMTIQLQFAKRGMENISEMQKNDIVIKEMDNGKKRIYLKDSLTKNHRGNDNSNSTNAFIENINQDNCPVKMIETYLSHLNSQNNYLWQRPLSTFRDQDVTWYANQKIGVNTIAKMMPTISENLQLSRRYTNHSLRATAITILGRKYQDTDIQSVSGHKSLSALGMYKRTSDETLSQMSKTLHDHLNKRPYQQSSDHAVVTPQEISELAKLNESLDTNKGILTNILRSNLPENVHQVASTSSDQGPILDDDGFKDLDFAGIDELCRKYSPSVGTIFKPSFTNCNNITFNISFNK